MLSFLRFSVVYLAVALVVVHLFRDNPGNVILSAWTTAVGTAPALSTIAFALMGVSLVISLVKNPQAGRDVIIGVVAAFFATLMLHGGFGLLKTSMPYIVPFWADPLFADLDRLLHFGVDPWIFVYDIAAYLPMTQLSKLYLAIWSLPAIALPVFLAAFDRDPARVRRTMILYVLTWLVLGNVMALAGMSVGPVYYDRLLGGERFAGLLEALQGSVLAGGRVLDIQDNLWRIYVENGQSFGAGISAFPSVHVGVATVTGLYMVDRSRWLAPFGVFFIVSIQFLAVYTGYHYAIDGYVSVLLLWLLWRWMRNRDRAQAGQGLP